MAGRQWPHNGGKWKVKPQDRENYLSKLFIEHHHKVTVLYMPCRESRKNTFFLSSCLLGPLTVTNLAIFLITLTTAIVKPDQCVWDCCFISVNWYTSFFPCIFLPDFCIHFFLSKKAHNTHIIFVIPLGCIRVPPPPDYLGLLGSILPKLFPTTFCLVAWEGQGKSQNSYIHSPAWDQMLLVSMNPLLPSTAAIQTGYPDFTCFPLFWSTFTWLAMCNLPWVLVRKVNYKSINF